MKRIRKIEIENSRAYYDRQEFILNKGENLLLYVWGTERSVYESVG